MTYCESAVLCTRHICRSWRRQRVRRRYIIVAMIVNLRGAPLPRAIMPIMLSSPMLRLGRSNYSHRFCSLMQVASGIIMHLTVCPYPKISFSVPIELYSHTDDARG